MQESYPDMPNSVRARQIVYRASHRGTREMDILLGEYAQAMVHTMSEREMARFEALLSQPDSLLLAWITGADAVPDDADSELLEAIAGHAAQVAGEE
jgi:antitoxin CptB